MALQIPPDLPAPSTLPLTQLSLHDQVQQRVALDPAHVAAYADLYREGHDLGRLVVFNTGTAYVLADGFHRVQAATQAGLTTVPVEVRPGDLRAAILYATSCNLHGQPLTNADKRKRVLTLLTDPTWAQWSDNAIAKHCGVTQPFVGTVRKSLITVISDAAEPGATSRTYQDKHGHVHTMETRKIGQHGQGSGEKMTAPAILTDVQDPEPPALAPSWPQAVSSGDYEWYTPPAVLTLVKEVLGAIDVDPASCAAAQAVVGATTYYTSDDDGLRQPWPGRVFCNPPYKMPEIARFIGKLSEELDAQRTKEAIVLVNAATETDWFQRAFSRANAVCFPDGRLHFVSPTRNGDHPCQGQALLYYGPHADVFCVVFAALGVSTRVVCAERPEAQLPLAAAHPPTPASLIQERDYCLVHVPPSKRGLADVDPCTLRDCHATAAYYFWTHYASPTGPVWVRRHNLCTTHTQAWCTAHQVDIKAIPRLTRVAWGKARTTGDYAAVPWFQFVQATP